MFPLYQRLKELDADTFQRLCLQLLKERHPGVELRHVEGACGDQGLDLFQGVLSENPVIWQCKAFPNGVGQSQKQQIKDSLRTALENFSPAQWILCLSVDLDAKSHRWFQKLQCSYAAKTRIGLFPASDIVHELVHRRALRNVFFPGAVIDVAELKSIVTRSGELTSEELERVADANIEDYIERLKDRDARFNYEIVYNGERGSAENPPQHRPGLVLSFGNGTKTINVLARDVEALRQNPPNVTIAFQGEGIEKINDFIQTGRSQELDSAEFSGVKSNWSLLQPLCKVNKDSKLVIQAPSLNHRRARTRVVFRSKTSTVEYGFIEFSLVRRGVREEEFVSVGNNLPFQLNFVVGINTGMCDIGLKQKFIGHEVRSIKKFCEALEILRAGSRIDAFDLERESLRLFSTETAGAEPTDGFQRFKAFVDDLAAVEDRFKVKLIWPKTVTQEDFEWATLLRCYAEGSTLELGNIRVDLVKSIENRCSGPELLAKIAMFRIEQQCLTPRPKIFGTEIATGRCAMTADRARIDGLATTIDRFNEAPVGAGVEITIIPEVPVRFELLDDQVIKEKS